MIKKLIGIIFAVLCIASACALDAGAGGKHGNSRGKHYENNDNGKRQNVDGGTL